MSAPQSQSNGTVAVHYFPDDANAKAKLSLTVTVADKRLRMDTKFDYTDDTSVSQTGELCIQAALSYAKGRGVSTIDKIIATAPVPTTDDSMLVVYLKLEWIGCLVGKDFHQVKPGASQPDAMVVDRSGIVEYEKAV